MRSTAYSHVIFTHLKSKWYNSGVHFRVWKCYYFARLCSGNCIDYTRAVLSFTCLQSCGLSSFTTWIMLSLPTLFFCFCYFKINSKVEAGRKAIQDKGVVCKRHYGRKMRWYQKTPKAMSGNRGQGLSHQWHQYKQYICPCRNCSLYPMCNGKSFKCLITFNVSNSAFQKRSKNS